MVLTYKSALCLYQLDGTRNVLCLHDISILIQINIQVEDLVTVHAAFSIYRMQSINVDDYM